MAVFHHRPPPTGEQEAPIMTEVIKTAGNAAGTLRSMLAGFASF